MKKIYLVRHGETLFNKRGKIQGVVDSPLTEEGVRQAKSAKEYYTSKNIIFDKAYCSTLGRAEETLKTTTDLPYERLEGIKEWNYGKFEGEPIYAGIPDKDFYKNNINFGDWWANFGGESVEEVQERVIKTLEKIAKDEGENALVISHGGVLWAIITKFFPTFESLKENNIERKTPNLMTIEFEVGKDYKLNFVRTFIPFNGNV
ncbi:histidine phosphatase family protein [Helcococcus massiliensis]|uniref:histidine phosphatase family protein n=1 Tax=Helcococcus massiliensis TaxID=2040290 RepID=UPI000CDE5F3E|nr:histidine phosphatase family protein [Helcococcus massiliensis]